jgi:hypothetical protein
MSARFPNPTRDRDDQVFRHLWIPVAVAISFLWCCLLPNVRAAEDRSQPVVQASPTATAEIEVASDAEDFAETDARVESVQPDEVLDDDLTCAFPRPQDQLWLVSTRQLGYPGCQPGLDNSLDNLDVRLYDASAGWQSSDATSLLSSQHAQDMTCVYVHGNRVEWNEALSQGRRLYRRLAYDDTDAPPLCFIIWSWPSSQISGQLRDVRVKAQRTNADGYYLGSFLSQCSPDRPTSLIGYSFGCRVVTGALHLRGGGILAGRVLSRDESPVVISETVDAVGRDDERPWATAIQSPADHAPTRVVLLAAALPNYWLSPGNAHGMAATQIDQVLLLYNSCDRVLKRYGLVEPDGRPQALGYTGLVYRTQWSPSQIEQRDVCCIVGKAHDESRYYASSGLMRRIRLHALWQESPATH